MELSFFPGVGSIWSNTPNCKLIIFPLMLRENRFAVLS
jgi:hypothetical protein